MRPDMGKVITERPRWGHRDSNLGTAMRVRWEGPDADYNIPVRSGRGDLKTKMFSDLLGPVERWTRAQVGRPWNKVFSELCRTFDRRKTTQRHVVEHICGRIGWVALNVVRDADGLWRPLGRSSAWSVPEFYVHPRTGLLCRQERPSWKRRRSNQGLPSLPVPGTDEWYEWRNGCWFRTRFVPERTRRPGMEPRLVAQRRQVGKKELRVVRDLVAALKTAQR